MLHLLLPTACLEDSRTGLVEGSLPVESEAVLVDDLLLGSGQDFWENLLVTSSREDTATLSRAALWNWDSLDTGGSG